MLSEQQLMNVIQYYILWISRCIAAAKERIPGSIDNYVTGVSECSQQRSNLKDDGYTMRTVMEQCYRRVTGGIRFLVTMYR
ncbi:hypothetical protein [Photorhabdus luminescens]|uniref:hypothetical protein n=1 Tax=Photorhabdus luminescens TaxID=29488 RepID=UPI0022409270|nr:hypothetical protein [Photorhabdus luminescens]MCW7763012.1 hypothetical protein [Photorhabdus luminescens subsp. venezuelensis]